MQNTNVEPERETPKTPPTPAPSVAEPAPRETEVGGLAGPEPTRYGDWEVKGIAVDF